MQRVNNIYKDICDIKHILNMYTVIKKNTKNKKKLELFEDYFVTNIGLIKTVLDSKNYTPDKYQIFIIYRPKTRLIMSNSITDKLINHLVAKYILLKVLDKELLLNNTATRVGMGTRYALNLFKTYLSIYKNKYNNFYILKLDIKKYFYNIDHEILFNMIKRKIKDKDALNIIYKIIDSTNRSYINERINNLNNKEVIKYKTNKGLSVGNMTSQILGIYYLNDIIRYIINDLHLKYIVNYMDDFVIIYHDKTYLKKCMKLIKDKLMISKKLELNKKSRIYNIKEGVEFLGQRFIINNHKLYIKVLSKKRINCLRKCKCKKNDVINSYLGYLSYGNNYYLKKRITYYKKYVV